MSFDDQWGDAEVGDNENAQSNLDPPDEGGFEVALIDGAAFTSKKGKDLVKLTLRVLNGEHEGYEWVEFRNFDSQGAANAAKTTCARVGVDVEDIGSLAELDAQLKALAGGYYDVNVVRNGEYLNTYINDRLGQSDIPADLPEPESVPAGAVRDDADIPF